MSAIPPDWILTFTEVAERGSVSTAAEHLHIGQPALSMRLKQLQEAIGEPLYRRRGRGLQLTPLGEELLGYGQRLRDGLRATEDFLDRRRRLQTGTLRIAASNTVASYFLPRKLAAFRARQPEIRMELHTGELERALADVGSWDLLFVEGEAPCATLPPHFAAMPWLTDEIVAVVRGDHRLAGKESVDFEEILAYPIIWRERGSGVRRVVEEALQTRGLSAPVVVEVTGAEAVRETVLAGLGVGFASVEAIRNAGWRLHGLHLNPPPGLTWTLSVIVPEEGLRSRPADAFLELLGIAEPPPVSP